MMNITQQEQIRDLQRKGMGYRKIARAIGLSENTVKSYCRRHPVTETGKIQEFRHRCLQCGSPIRQDEKRKVKKFCSDSCRMIWWNSHRNQVKHRIVRQLECPYCHRTFSVYGNGFRKYCSHACYVADRFGDDQHED